MDDVDVSRSSSSSFVLSQSLYLDFDFDPYRLSHPKRRREQATHAARANPLALGLVLISELDGWNLEPVPRHRDPSIPHRPSRRDVNVVSVSRISHRIALSSCRSFTHTHTSILWLWDTRRRIRIHIITTTYSTRHIAHHHLLSSLRPHPLVRRVCSVGLVSSRTCLALPSPCRVVSFPTGDFGD